MSHEDMALVREFAASQAEPAFAALVERHIGLVHAAALRRVGDPQLAEEITQAVFILLARKAGTLGPKTILPGWLYRTTRYLAADALKIQRRRERREQEACMQSLRNEPEPPVWREIAPLLESAMDALNDPDRNAILLRFFEDRTLAEVGRATGVSEDAARVRVNRALEKLQRYFAKRGISSTTAILAGAIAGHSAQVAPAALTQAVTAMAVAKGAAASASTLTLIHGALKIMAWSKIKTAAILGIGVLLLAGTAAVTVHQLRKPRYNPDDFWATRYPTGPADMMQFMTNTYGHPLNYSFPVAAVQGCSVSGLLNQCMEISGWRYLIDKDVAAGSVQFGAARVMNGAEWVAAFEAALQNNRPQWWDGKLRRMRNENLVLIRLPQEKVVLVLPRDKAVRYQ